MNQPNPKNLPLEVDEPAPSVLPPLDPFADDTPLVCGIENPDDCEACT